MIEISHKTKLNFVFVIPYYGKELSYVKRLLDSIDSAVKYGKKYLRSFDTFDYGVTVVNDADTEHKSDLEKLVNSYKKMELVTLDQNVGCFLARVRGVSEYTELDPFTMTRTWLVHIDPDDALLENFFFHIINFMMLSKHDKFSCVAMEDQQVYEDTGVISREPQVAHLTRFLTLRSVADSNEEVTNSVCDKLWNLSWWMHQVNNLLEKSLSKENIRSSLLHINYMEDFLYSMIYLQYPVYYKYCSIPVEIAYYSADNSSCKETESDKDKLYSAAKKVTDALLLLSKNKLIELDELLRQRYLNQMNRIKVDISLPYNLNRCK